MIIQEINIITFQIIIASVLDMLFADPYWFPHPVKGIGKIIDYGEIVLRKSSIPEKISGLVLTVFVVGFSYFVTLVLIKWCLGFGDGIQLFVNAVIVYFAISIRGLVKEAEIIINKLENDDIEGARNALSNIVGRDTKSLSEKQIMQACIESLAENMVDGILSPLFFAFIGGAPLAIAYKAVNTLDSMIGYKNKRYINFGLVAAKLDDAANFFPARISRVIIPAASFICGASPYKSMMVSLRDGHKHPSPNSAISEAAFAGALRIQLGGDAVYNGVRSGRPVLGTADDELTLNKVKKAIQIVYVSSFLSIITGIVVLFIIKGKLN